MTRYAAFLRGINVGGRTIKMDALKACLSEAGFADLKTILQTGNVVFDSPKNIQEVKHGMESTLTAAFNYDAKVQVVAMAALSAIVEAYPFGEPVEGAHDYVVFIENQLESQLAGEIFEPAEGEFVKPGAGVIYWRVDKGSTLTTPFAKLLTRAKYKAFSTTRNLNTLQKVLGA